MAAHVRFNQGCFERATLNVAATTASNGTHRQFDVMGRRRLSATARLDANGGIDEVHVARREQFLQIGFPVFDPTNPGKYDDQLTAIILNQQHWVLTVDNYNRVQAHHGALVQNPALNYDKVILAQLYGLSGRQDFYTNVIDKDLTTAGTNNSTPPVIDAAWFDDKVADGRRPLEMMKHQAIVVREEFARLRRIGQLVRTAPVHQGLNCEEELYLIRCAFDVAKIGYNYNILI